jgi:anti-sigma B factor antagonist
LVTPQLKIRVDTDQYRGPKRNIILDLSQVKFADSSGLSSLLVGHRLCKNATGSFILCGLNEAVSRLVTISQLDNVLSIVPSCEEGYRPYFYGRDRKRIEERS